MGVVRRQPQPTSKHRRRLRLHRTLRWVAPALALPMLALTLIPAEVWKAPINDAVYRGFDANLIYTSGAVRVAPNTIDAVASANTITTVNLATTQRQRLAAAVDVTVLQNQGAIRPVRIGVWSPWTGSGYFVAFGPAPNDEIAIQTVSAGSAGATLLGGNVTSTPISNYELGQSYLVGILVDRAAGIISASVSNRGATIGASLTKSESPALFGSVPISLTASSDPGDSTSRFNLRDYNLTLPHERVWASTIADPIVRGLMIFLAVLGVLAIAVAGVSSWRGFLAATVSSWQNRVSWLAIGGAILYVAGNAVLFPLGGHPFDFGNERLYAYVARAYGSTQLYFVPGLTALASIWGGVPLAESEFPYSPVIAYVFTGIGWLGSFLFAGGGTIGPASVQLGYLIKAVNVAFGLADGALIYLVLRELKVGERWSRIGAAFFVLNPAVWFSMSIWGQTHVISIFFVLLSILFAQRNMPFWAWLTLVAACLTRPQIVVFGLLLGVVLLRKFTWHENMLALSWAAIVTFVGLLPLTLATSPSLPIDIMLNNLLVQGGSGSQAVQSTVSESAYSLWPLVTYLFHGASGIYRAYTPSANLLVGPITYQRAGQVLTALSLVVVTAALIVRKRSVTEAGGYLPLVAVGVTSFLMLLTGIVATHFLLALPLLLLCRRWMDSIAYCFVAAVWSISTLVPMFGDMGNVISSNAYPLLAPANSPVTRFFVGLYGWDRFITVAVVANICAVIWVAVLAFRSPSSRAAVSAGASA